MCLHKPDTTEIHVVFGKDAKMSIEEPNIMQGLKNTDIVYMISVSSIHQL